VSQLDIDKIAFLARLKLGDDEKQKIADKLALVLSHFEKISEVDTQGVEPLVTPIEIEQVLRVDQAVMELTPEEILKNAPAKQGNLFKVPPVI
jgi:aspartyl-tRNA(Asn)/glutamyl-tRNA(Gln) amidotransferase subunit C